MDYLANKNLKNHKINDTKPLEKNRESIGKKYKQKGAKLKNRPGSASDKGKQRKLFKKADVLIANSRRLVEVEKQLDQLFDSRFNNNGNNMNSYRSESNISENKNVVIQKQSHQKIVNMTDKNGAKVPLPPPPLNLDELVKSKPDWGTCDNIISTQAKHIQNLQEICKVYYSHIWKVYSNLNKQPTGTVDNFKNRSSKEHSNERSASNYENDLTLKQKSKSENFQKTPDENWFKLENKKEFYKFKDPNKLKLSMPNSSDLTEANQEKSTKLEKYFGEVRGKSLKIKTDSSASTQEKIDPKFTKEKLMAENSAIDEKNAWENSQKRPGPKNGLTNITRKEFNFNDSLNNDADKIFDNDLSLIKNEIGVIKKKDTSEIYGQWLNDSNADHLPTSEWTFKVPFVHNIDSSVESWID